MRTRKHLLVNAIVFAVVALPVFGSVAASQCDVKQTRAAVPVYATPPEFSTASGWVLGPRREALPTLLAGATVRVCESRSIGFLGWSRVWLRIRIELPSGESTEGWIYGDGAGIATRRTGASTYAALFGPAVAYAQATEASLTAPDSGLPDGGIPLFRLWAFIGICFGMAAKGAFDRLQIGSDFVVHDYLLQTIPALLVSPIVFLGLTSLGEVHLAATPSIVTFCVAFQSGFFWQTVLARAPSPTAHRTSPSLIAATPAPAS